MIAMESANRGVGGWAAVLFVGFAPAVEIMMLVLALLLAPAWAAGDDVVSSFKRSVKGVYWSTTVLIPASMLSVVVWVLVEGLARDLYLGFVRESVFALLFGAGVFATAVYMSLAFGRLLSTHAMASGPPHCDDCGYLLTGLPADGLCPQRGLAVRDSLPGGRRRPEAWRVNALSMHGILNLLRLQCSVLRTSTVFREIPIHSSAGFARRFFAATLASMAIVVMLVARAAMSFWPQAGDVSHWIGVSGITIIAGTFVLRAMMMVPVGLFARFACGIRDFRTSTTVWYMLGPLLWPVIAVATLAMPLWIGPWRQWLHETVPTLFVFRHHINGAQVYAGACATAATVVTLFCLLRLRQALRAVRFANT